mgnify:CR=1 FL=1
MDKQTDDQGDKVHIKIPKGTLRALKELAAKRKTTISNVIRQAVNTEHYMDQQIMRGYEILAKEPDSDEMWRVVFPHLD